MCRRSTSRDLLVRFDLSPIACTYLRRSSVSNAVVPFETDTPRDLIIQLHPNVLVKGGDYTIDQIAGAREVCEWGGVVEIIPLTLNQSTTSIVQAVRAARAGSEG